MLLVTYKFKNFQLINWSWIPKVKIKLIRDFNFINAKIFLD